jgi:hypothetical protein
VKTRWTFVLTKPELPIPEQLHKHLREKVRDKLREQLREKAREKAREKSREQVPWLALGSLNVYWIFKKITSQCTKIIINHIKI